MSVSGKKFLGLAKARELTVTGHALRRIEEHTGRFLSEERAVGLLHRARHVPHEDLFLLGYRPAYRRRKQDSESSWYFRFELDGAGLIAVVGQGSMEGQYVWLTAYGRNEQTDAYRVASFEALMEVA